jgi:MYXO-CTERM domain-containing protein
MRRLTRLRSSVLFALPVLLALGGASRVARGDGGGGGAPAVVCVDDGLCVTPGEDCTCADCSPLALCNPGQCVDDGVCDLRDACICKDCAADSYCSEPSRCVDDGYCDTLSEGCACFDCKDTRRECAEWVAPSSSVSSSSGGPLPTDDGGSCAMGAPTAPSPALLALGVGVALLSARRRRR